MVYVAVFSAVKGGFVKIQKTLHSDLSSFALKEFTVLALTVSSGSAFQGFVTRFVKNLFRISQFLTISPT